MEAATDATRPKIYESDATDADRKRYVDVCEALNFLPFVGELVEKRAPISCRGEPSDRLAVRTLASHLGVTRNTLVLTALRIGMLAMDEALTSIDSDD